MNSIFFLIYLTITQSGSIGMEIVDKHFPSLDRCHSYMETIFLPDFIEKKRTWNFYSSRYKVMMKDSEDGSMRTYMSCVEKPEMPCGYFWPCDDLNIKNYGD